MIDVFGLSGGNFFAAVNYDSIASTDPAIFIVTLGDHLYYNRLKWVNGFSQAPQWQDSTNPWPSLTPSPSFYDLFNDGIRAPQAVGSRKVQLSWQGSRLMMATARSIGGTQFLWTCRQIGVNSSGDNDIATHGAADRSAVEWFKIQFTPTVNIADSGRIFDNSANPKFYYIPSLAVNKNGDMVVGFSGSSANSYINAYYTGKSSAGLSPTSPIAYFNGITYFDGGVQDFRWGDFSHTTVDPDGLRIWTIQEYAETRFQSAGNINAWGTRIVCVTPF